VLAALTHSVLELSSDPDGFHGFWLNSGIRHLLELRINYKLGTIALDDSKGASMVRTWRFLAVIFG
jgi:hypothetical protein